MTDDITLPPLPPHRLGERWPHHVVWGYEDMVAFARAAVLLDRQQRAAPTYGSIAERAAAGKDAGLWQTAPSAEPVAWMYTSKYSDGRRYLTRYQTDLSTYKADAVWPLYTTPPDHLAVMRQALDVLEQLHGGCTDSDDGTVEAITVWCPEVIDALRAATGGEQ